MLAVKGAVIGGVDDDGVIGGADFIQRLQDPPDGDVDTGEKPIKILHGFLVGGRRKIHGLAETADRVVEKLRHRRAIHRLDRRHRGISEERIEGAIVRIFGVDAGLIASFILNVRGFEAHRQAESLAVAELAQELDRLIGLEIGQMLGAAGLEIEPLSAEAGEVIVAIGRERIGQSPFADEAHLVTGASQQHGIAVVEQRLGQRNGEIGDAVAAGIEAGEQAGPAGHANGGGGKRLAKVHAAVGQRIDVRGLQDGVAGTTERVGTLVVGDQKNDVGRGPASREGRLERSGVDRPCGGGGDAGA